MTTALRRAVEITGSQSELARRIGVRQMHVWNWLNRSKSRVPGEYVIAIEKGSYSGNTMLNAATVDLNGTTANAGVTATLTATGADLDLAAADPVCCEYNAGTQGTDAEQVTVTVEALMTDE